MAGAKPPKSTELRRWIARRLSAARWAYDENGANVARACGVSKQVMHKYEKGGAFPDELFLVRFSKLTKVPLDWLFKGEITAEMPADLAARIGARDPDLIGRGPLGEPRSNANKPAVTDPV